MFPDMNWTNLLASFTSPMHVENDIRFLLFIFPLLASVAFVYKATKVRVMRWKTYLRQSLIVWLTLSVVMIAAALILHIVVWFLTT